MRCGDPVPCRNGGDAGSKAISEVRGLRRSGRLERSALPPIKGQDRGCFRLVIVDLNTGVVHSSPFANKESQFALPPSNWDWRQPQYWACKQIVDRSQRLSGRAIQFSARPVIPARSPILGAWEGEWLEFSVFGMPDPAAPLVSVLERVSFSFRRSACGKFAFSIDAFPRIGEQVRCSAESH